MRLCLIGLAGKEQEDTEVGLRVEIARIGGDGSGKFRNCEIRALLAKIFVGLLLMGMGLRRLRGVASSPRADLWRWSEGGYASCTSGLHAYSCDE